MVRHKVRVLFSKEKWQTANAINTMTNFLLNLLWHRVEILLMFKLLSPHKHWRNNEQPKHSNALLYTCFRNTKEHLLNLLFLNFRMCAWNKKHPKILKKFYIEKFFSHLSSCFICHSDPTIINIIWHGNLRTLLHARVRNRPNIIETKIEAA